MKAPRHLALALLVAGSLTSSPLGAAESAAPANPPPCQGPGPCAGSGPGTTSGYNLMTPQEHADHLAKMAGMKSKADCAAYVAQHHAEMVKRAQAQGKPMPMMQHDPCAMFQKRWDNK